MGDRRTPYACVVLMSACALPGYVWTWRGSPADPIALRLPSTQWISNLGRWHSLATAVAMSNACARLSTPGLSTHQRITSLPCAVMLSPRTCAPYSPSPLHLPITNIPAHLQQRAHSTFSSIPLLDYHPPSVSVHMYLSIYVCNTPPDRPDPRRQKGSPPTHASRSR